MVRLPSFLAIPTPGDDAITFTTDVVQLLVGHPDVEG